MKPKSILISPTALDRNGISVAETMAGAGNMAITGSLATASVATLSPPCHIGIYAGGNESGRTITITGTDRNDQAMTEAITGPNNTTVVGNRNFKTVTQVAVDAATAGDVEIGSSDALESKWIQMDRCNGGDISLAVVLSSGASLTYAMQHTFTDIQTTGFLDHSANAIVHATVTAETTTQNGSYSTPINAMRLAITSFVSGTATIEFMQAAT